MPGQQLDLNEDSHDESKKDAKKDAKPAVVAILMTLNLHRVALAELINFHDPISYLVNVSRKFILSRGFLHDFLNAIERNGLPEVDFFVFWF